MRDVIMQRHPWQWSRCRGLDVPSEWMPALVELSDAVADRVTEDLARESFSWRDIKEKRGSLSIDYSGPDIDDLMEVATSRIENLKRQR